MAFSKELEVDLRARFRRSRIVTLKLCDIPPGEINALDSNFGHLVKSHVLSEADFNLEVGEGTTTALNLKVAYREHDYCATYTLWFTATAPEEVIPTTLLWAFWLRKNDGQKILG